MTVSLSFDRKKQKIISDLSVPDEEYTDLSPKGSVDVGIRDLIRDLNSLDGIVTTSSCAGRISVFLEGSGRAKASSSKGDTGNNESYPEGEQGSLDEAASMETSRFAPTGGKGSGQWLFVSHEPVERYSDSLHELFGLQPGNGQINMKPASGGLRLVRFHFEPMILHIMTSSLEYAKPILAAASSSGFRESGVQGLRCIDDPDSCPIVAVRSSGLALESIIGYVADDVADDGVVIKSLVSEEYLQMLMAAANERFKTNAERRERFRVKLLQLLDRLPSEKKEDWEDPNARRERKRAEGLLRSKVAKEKKAVHEELHGPEDRDIEDIDDVLFGSADVG